MLFYLLFLLLMGIPVLSMELAVGRAGQGTATTAYKALEPAGSRWHLHGWVCLLGCCVLMMYYTTVNGWMMIYFVKFLTGTFDGLADGASASIFSGMLADPVQMSIATGLTVLIGFALCSRGLQKGLERISKWMMLALLALIIILAINSMTLSGAGEGLSFYLIPDWERAKSVGLGNVMGDAMNQAFFTLSLGIGAMEIFGSYMKRDHTLASESLRICALDTFVALCAGLIIFPACFSFGVSPDAGPQLIFITLPTVFSHMFGSRLWGSLFFLFMTFASFPTVLAVFENILASLMELFHLTRRRAALVGCILILLASAPCVLGYNLWGNFHPLGGTSTVLDGEDFLVSNLLLPLGSLIYLLFCVTKWGWGFDRYLAEANTGTGKRFPRWLKPYFSFVLPILILIILLQGLL